MNKNINRGHKQRSVINLLHLDYPEETAYLLD